ncbi:CEF1 [Candida pseudojiufengensis]|uniref:CEF1 n=1 Tax=Candida pseudojiufengensis TaxID=497109 RepID=UPI00222518F4|nr:CEF1 [Candida pseudojiufengensis]KAI5960565.1 CEF1 [Candida pseudojiufengensis]
MSTYTKGGAWTNIEDEILKAAVQKYGSNQWARVSSLLPKKTAQQAKSRWVEWLNPLINKSDWTPEQDKRLIEVHKVLPNQWRSISTIIGRTATQCVERYQHLIDKTYGIENNEFKLSGPGIETLPATGQPSIQIFDEESNDPNFASETKPPESDNEDMEDEDREMIAEAKARLANTQGKKAKRKARERMLEESKRLALLQKRRDLKAAGINSSISIKNKRKKNEFDYVADIPHEIIPQEGPYNINEEIKENEKELNQFQFKVSKSGISNKEVDDKIRKNREKSKRERERKRKKDESEEVEHDKDRRIEFKKRKTDNDTTTTPLDQDKLEKSPIQRKPNKSLIPLIKSIFEKLPEPIHHQGKPTPIFEESQDDLQLGNQPLVDTKDENLELLKSIDREKSQRRKSQVVQKNLPLIDPSTIKRNENSTSEVDQLIDKEFLNLITTDFKSQMNPFINISVFSDIDENLYQEVRNEIETKLNNTTTHDEHKQISKFELPKNFEIADMIISKLHNLHNSSKILTNSLNSSSQSYNDELNFQINQINDTYKKILESDIEYKSLVSKFDEDEKINSKEIENLKVEVDRVNKVVDTIRQNLKDLLPQTQSK